MAGRVEAIRRNVTVSGVDLDALVGRPVLAALAHRAGLRADIREGGEFAVGDPVEPA